jgi:hypothetical protein
MSHLHQEIMDMTSVRAVNYQRSSPQGEHDEPPSPSMTPLSQLGLTF